MSDGNYNRNLLPYRDYQSGLRAGRAQTVARAVALLEKLLSSSTLPADEKEELLNTFRTNLSSSSTTKA